MDKEMVGGDAVSRCHSLTAKMEISQTGLKIDILLIHVDIATLEHFFAPLNILSITKIKKCRIKIIFRTFYL